MTLQPASAVLVAAALRRAASALRAVCKTPFAPPDDAALSVIDRRVVDIVYWLVLKPPSREWVRVSLRLPKRRR